MYSARFCGNLRRLSISQRLCSRRCRKRPVSRPMVTLLSDYNPFVRLANLIFWVGTTCRGYIEACLASLPGDLCCLIRYLY